MEYRRRGRLPGALRPPIHDATRIVVVTEGILVQWLQRDPFLDGVAAVIFDEFHERNLHSDLSLAMCPARVQREARPELRIVVMSATLDPRPLVEYLGEDVTGVVDSPGRLHPVEVDTSPARRAAHPIRGGTGVERMLDRRTATSRLSAGRRRDPAHRKSCCSLRPGGRASTS